MELFSLGRPKKKVYLQERVSFGYSIIDMIWRSRSRFLFARDNGRKANIGDYDPLFRNFLELGQTMHPELFTTGVLIGDFILIRGQWHGETTEAENNNVYTVAI